MAQVLPILPPSDLEIEDFDEIDCVPTGKNVNIVDDDELSKPIIDIVGNDSRITFFSRTTLPLLVLHLNAVRRFFSLIITARDHEGTSRILEISNKRSTVAITNNTCKTPLEIGDGWQRICLNLDDMVSRAFGKRYSSCSEVAVCGTSRLAVMYFQDKEYADCQLPLFLRVASQNTDDIKK
jgi:hypothetical protein